MCEHHWMLDKSWDIKTWVYPPYVTRFTKRYKYRMSDWADGFPLIRGNKYRYYCAKCRQWDIVEDIWMPIEKITDHFAYLDENFNWHYPVGKEPGTKVTKG